VYRAPPTTHDLGDGAVKQALRATARRKVLALVGTKFGQGALAVVCALAALDVVVTDDGAPDSVVAGLEAAGVDVRRV
jgi:DeoR/GlpR family transcriptional regulator of sugar metabolism